jgi:hypothetical protein
MNNFSDDITNFNNLEYAIVGDIGGPHMSFEPSMIFTLLLKIAMASKELHQKTKTLHKNIAIK